MTCCQQCTGWAYEHLTSDQRIVYCAQCGWEHRERRAADRSPASVARRSGGGGAPTRTGRRHG